MAMRRALIAVFVLVGACSSSSTNASDAGADTTSDDGASGACNAVFVGPAIVQTQVASDPPAPTGGDVAQGVYYVLTAFNTYTGAGGASGPTARTLAAQIQTVATHWQLAASDDGGPIESSTADVAFSGTNVTQTFTCPSGTPAKTQAYSATATELRLYTSRGASTDELVLTKK